MWILVYIWHALLHRNDSHKPNTLHSYCCCIMDGEYLKKEALFHCQKPHTRLDSVIKPIRSTTAWHFQFKIFVSNSLIRGKSWSIIATAAAALAWWSVVKHISVCLSSGWYLTHIIHQAALQQDFKDGVLGFTSMSDQLDVDTDVVHWSGMIMSNIVFMKLDITHLNTINRIRFYTLWFSWLLAAVLLIIFAAFALQLHLLYSSYLNKLRCDILISRPSYYCDVAALFSWQCYIVIYTVVHIASCNQTSTITLFYNFILTNHHDDITRELMCVYTMAIWVLFESHSAVWPDHLYSNVLSSDRKWCCFYSKS